MKLALILSLCFETVLCTPGTLGIDIYRARKPHGGRLTRGNALAYERFQEAVAKGDGNELVPESLTNGFYAYFANMTIGSDDQAVNPMIDTGSSDLWVTSRLNPYCTQDPDSNIDSGDRWDCTGFIYDPSTSTSYRNLSDPFHISYADTTGAYGWLSQDTVKLGGATVPNATFAYATTANSSDSVFGVGYAGNEATTLYYRNGSVSGLYKNIPILLKEDGYINTVAYSLYLNDANSQTGQVLFGGVDHAKYDGTLGLMPLVDTYYPQINYTIEFMVRFSGMSVRTGSNVCPLADFVVPALLDSGTSYAVLPSDLVGAMGKAMDYTWPNVANASYYQGPCSNSFNFDSFELDFLGKKLQAPPSSLLDYLQDADGEYVYDDQGKQLCILAIDSALPGDDYVLGDVFQRNWYVVYDLDNYQVALAQGKLNETSESNIEPIVSTVPGATSVKNYNLGGFQSNIATHSVAGSCFAKATSKPVSASSATPVSSFKSSVASSIGPARNTSAAGTYAPGVSASPASTPAHSAFASGSQLAAAHGLSSRTQGSSPSYVTTVVSSFVTTCPSPTTFATNGKTYTVTEPTVLTITDCPCTLTHHESSTSSVSESTSSTPKVAAATETVSAVSTFVTTCSAPTTFAKNGKTYTVTEATVLTITDCSCTEEESAKPVKTDTVSATSSESSSALASGTVSGSFTGTKIGATGGAASKSAGVGSAPSYLSPSLAPQSSAPVLANSASHIGVALSALVGALVLLIV